MAGSWDRCSCKVTVSLRSYPTPQFGVVASQQLVRESVVFKHGVYEVVRPFVVSVIRVL